MVRFVSFLVVVSALAMPGLSSADTLDNQLAQLRPIVTQWWAAQGLTATRCDTVEFSRRDYGPNDGTWATTLEGTDLAHPLWANERIPVCHVVFAERLVLESPAKVCAVELHEWGHVLGLDHTTDPTDIMYGGGIIAPPPACAAWGSPPAKGQGSAGLVRGRKANRNRLRRVMALCRLHRA